MAKKPRQPRKVEVALRTIREHKAELREALKLPNAIQAKIDEQRRIVKDLLPKCKFVWNDVTYSISDIQHRREWNYDDCPCTPGYKSSQDVVRLPKHVYIDDYTGHQSDRPNRYKEFSTMIREQFGFTLNEICPIVDIKER